MQYAQQRSVIDNKEYQIRLDSSMNKYWLLVEAPIDETIGNEKRFERFTGRLGKVFVVPKRIGFKVDQKTICFYPDGLMDKAQIDLTDQKNEIVVSTKEQRGNVYVYEIEK
ncbi:MAG: hypothetical protein P9M12_07215 [Candidatus Aceula lacicola]|nr:hypothetical protein [Candidatus Aceula lacicola]